VANVKAKKELKKELPANDDLQFLDAFKEVIAARFARGSLTCK